MEWAVLIVRSCFCPGGAVWRMGSLSVGGHYWGNSGCAGALPVLEERPDRFPSGCSAAERVRSHLTSPEAAWGEGGFVGCRDRAHHLGEAGGCSGLLRALPAAAREELFPEARLSWGGRPTMLPRHRALCWQFCVPPDGKCRRTDGKWAAWALTATQGISMLHFINKT